MPSSASNDMCVVLPSGERIVIIGNDFSGMFMALLGYAMACDYFGPMLRDDWHGIQEACDRELHYLAGQLAARNPGFRAITLRSSFYSWYEELQAKLDPELARSRGRTGVLLSGYIVSTPPTHASATQVDEDPVPPRRRLRA